MSMAPSESGGDCIGHAGGGEREGHSVRARVRPDTGPETVPIRPGDQLFVPNEGGSSLSRLRPIQSLRLEGAAAETLNDGPIDDRTDRSMPWNDQIASIRRKVEEARWSRRRTLVGSPHGSRAPRGGSRTPPTQLEQRLVHPTNLCTARSKLSGHHRECWTMPEAPREVRIPGSNSARRNDQDRMGSVSDLPVLSP
jgi:hypothetical protein